MSKVDLDYDDDNAKSTSIQRRINISLEQLSKELNTKIGEKIDILNELKTDILDHFTILENKIHEEKSQIEILIYNLYNKNLNTYFEQNKDENSNDINIGKYINYIIN